MYVYALCGLLMVHFIVEDLALYSMALLRLG